MPSTQRRYIRLCLIACLALLVVLSGFQALWVFGGSGTSIMYQAGLQRDLVERIDKDVLTLAYRPIAEHAQAINELQNILPVFEHAQVALQSGDRAMGLPLHPPDVVLQLMAASQSDFTAIDTATKKILALPSDVHIDPVEVDIVASHERGYFLALSQVNMAWMHSIDDAFWQIFLIEEGIVVVVVAGLIIAFFLSRRIEEIHGTHELSLRQSTQQPNT